MNQIIKRRIQLANRYLLGKGVEFGALHNPLAIDHSTATVLYADKYNKSSLLNKFSELKEIQDSIVETDLFIDLNQDDLQILVEYNFDFFIANHVLEHLVNPLRFLKRISNLMRSGSCLYLAVPNKEHTFDRNRSLTTWDHLYQEYQNNTSVLSREHLDDFIMNITRDHINDPRRKKELYEDYKYWFKRFSIRAKHRQRSIHVHVWNQNTFDQFLTQAINKLNLNFKILNDTDNNKIQNSYEMIYILRKE